MLYDIWYMISWYMIYEIYGSNINIECLIYKCIISVNYIIYYIIFIYHIQVHLQKYLLTYIVSNIISYHIIYYNCYILNYITKYNILYLYMRWRCTMLMKVFEIHVIHVYRPSHKGGACSLLWRLLGWLLWLGLGHLRVPNQIS